MLGGSPSRHIINAIFILCHSPCVTEPWERSCIPRKSIRPAPTVRYRFALQSWIADEYERYHRGPSGVVSATQRQSTFVRKDVNRQYYDTGRGIMLAVANMLEAFTEGPIQGKSFVIQVRDEI